MIFLLAVVLYPSVILVRNSFFAGGTYSLVNYLRLFKDPTTYSTLMNSLVVSMISTLGATVLGVFLAWVMARTDLPLKGLWRTMLIVPYLIPPFIGAIAWVQLLGPVGYVNKLYMALTGTSKPLFVVYGQWGIILVMILYSYPIAYMTNLGFFERANPALEEAARISGAGLWRSLRDVAIPLAMPSVGASALLILMSLMANFGIPAVIGFPARYFVLTTKIYATILNYDMPNNLQVAAALAMLLVVLAAMVMLAHRYILSKGSYAVVSGQAMPAQLVELGQLKWLVFALAAFLAFVAVIGPLLAILLTSITYAPGLPLKPENLSLRHYQSLLFGVPKVRRAIRNSLLLAASSAAIIAFLSSILAYLITRIRFIGSRLVEIATLVPYAVPGTIVALAMILAWLQPLPVLHIRLYNTIWILLIAYITRFLTLGLRSVVAAFEQIHESLEEAARISGADFLNTIKDITLPLIKTSIFAGWFLCFMPALTELTLSVLLFSVGNETLGVVVFGLHQEGKINLTAAIAFLTTIIVLGMNVLIRRFTGKTLAF
ncbi:MAG: ABC transporter permease [Anaerolineae bacterium]